MNTGPFWLVTAPYRYATLLDSSEDAAEQAEKLRRGYLEGLRPNVENAARVRVLERAYPEPVTVTGYDAEQTTAIQEEVYEAEMEVIRCPGAAALHWSDRIAERQSQKFAVFGDTAYKLLPFDHLAEDGGAFDYRPVFVDGRMLLMEYDEGGSSLLYLMRCTMRRHQPQANPKWRATFIGAAGWLRTSELEQSPAEILDHIAAEIAAGENVLTHRPAGWA